LSTVAGAQIMAISAFDMFRIGMEYNLGLTCDPIG
jgi:L-serine deaminase